MTISFGGYHTYNPQRAFCGHLRFKHPPPYLSRSTIYKELCHDNFLRFCELTQALGKSATKIEDEAITDRHAQIHILDISEFDDQIQRANECTMIGLIEGGEGVTIMCQ